VVIRFRARPLQHEEVEGREERLVEAQSGAAVRQRVTKVRAGPVQHGHEIVADRAKPAGREVAQRLAVIVEEGVEIPLPDLDRLVHRQALDHAPAQAQIRVRLDRRLAGADLLHAPHHAVGDLVQGRDDARGTGLPDVLEPDRIVGSEPTPGLLHAASPRA
jgi:hypothetical protein